jgi:hypothetical protein
MAAETGLDGYRDSPWRRLPVTLPGALLIGLLGLWAGGGLMPGPVQRPFEQPTLEARFIELPPPPPPARAREPAREPPPRQDEARPEAASAPPPAKTPASLAAPPAPSAEEWQRASTYTLKNSKRYRHNWGQMVRSMMGTALEGPAQGVVRFRIEIAPDGRIAKVEELWSTSETASRLAWQAIRNLPPTPPTPTGRPLIFEQTISFLPYETGWPPSYKLDCLPDPPAFQNPFAWDGASAQPAARPRPAGETPSAGESPPTECVSDSTADSIEEEEQELKRQMDKNRWGR